MLDHRPLARSPARSINSLGFLDSYLVAIDDGRWRNFRGRRTQLTRTELSDRELAIQILDCTHLICQRVHHSLRIQR